jgi:gluconate 2-dehydrogenase gamma chain
MNPRKESANFRLARPTPNGRISTTMAKPRMPLLDAKRTGRESAPDSGTWVYRRITGITRRRLLASTSILVLSGFVNPALGRTYRGTLPWEPSDTAPPIPVRAGALLYFTSDEAAAVEAIADRLIPHDNSGPGGKEAGCAVFIDRQLAGSFGDSRRLYMRPPFAKGTPSQGPQSPTVPKDRYRISLAALGDYCKATFAGKTFAALTAVQQDQVLNGLESGEIDLKDGSGKAFFEQILADTIEGFFADPIYGGNRDMMGWNLIGFPGARYDYRDHVAKHNQPYPLPPVSILGRSGWSVPT